MLPTGDMAWPPEAMRREILRVTGWAALYGGEHDDGGSLAPGGSGSASRWRMLSRDGGVLRKDSAQARVGRVESSPLHVPVPADVARTSADLLFAEAPKITVPNEAAQGRLDELLEAVEIDTTLLESAELCAALSGMYWRVVGGAWPAPRVSMIQPDNAWPEWSWGDLTAVTFVRRLDARAGDGAEGSPDRIVWRHLERHSYGMTPAGAGAIIEHGLYAGREDKLGRRMPLVEHPQVADIAAMLTGPEGDMIVLPGVPMTAGYVPNMRPNRKDRGSRLGRSDYEQVESLFASIDDAWTSWMRDLRLGKARLVVPEEYLRDEGAGKGTIFDVDREVYEPLRMMTDGGAQSIASVQFAIRVTEHAATLRGLLQQAVSSAGYSLRTFGMGDGDFGSAVTATQVDSEDRLSMITREKKSRYWTAGLRELVACLLAVDNLMNRTSVDPGGSASVEFRDSIAEDLKNTADTVNLLRAAEAASTQTLVALVHPEWSETEVAEEVNRIEGARGTPLPDPAMAGAGILGDLEALGALPEGLPTQAGPVG
jgi:hypothetical protein